MPAQRRGDPHRLPPVSGIELLHADVRMSVVKPGTYAPLLSLLRLLSLPPLMALLAGCVVGPQYIPPAADVPVSWRHLEDDLIQVDGADLSGWWSEFNDAVLHHRFEELSYFHIAWSYCAMK